MIADIYAATRQLATLADLKDVHLLGDENLALNLAAPRIVWVPVSNSYLIGRRRTGPNAGEERSIFTRVARVDVHLWSKAKEVSPENVDELRALEVLEQRFVSALRSIAFGNMTLAGSSYGSTEGESIAEHGLKLVLTIQFEVPMLDVERATEVTQPRLIDITANLRPGDVPPGTDETPVVHLP